MFFDCCKASFLLNYNFMRLVFPRPSLESNNSSLPSHTPSIRSTLLLSRPPSSLSLLFATESLPIITSDLLSASLT